MKKLLVLSVLLVVLVTQTYAAKIIYHTETLTLSTGDKVQNIPIDAQYIGMQATFIISGEVYGDDQMLSCSLYNPSGSQIMHQSANDPGDVSGAHAYESVTITYTGNLESGSYQAVVLGYGNLVELKSILCIVWDAPGQDVIDLKAELQADIATAKAELQGSIDTKTAGLQTQIDTKAQELADLADEHDADQILLLGQIATNAINLTALEQKHDQEVAVLAQTMADNKTELETALNQLELKHDQEVAVINQTITTLEAKLDSEILAVYTEISTLNTTLDAFILETRAAQDYLSEQISALNTAITERLRRLENRVKLAVYASTKLAEMKTQTETSALAKQAEIVQLDLEIQALEDAGQDASLKIALRDIALTEYSRLQIDLEDIVAAITLRENDSEFAALRAEIVSLYSITAAMDARIVELEGLVVILKKSIEDGDDELHAKIDAQITLLREEIMDKIDKDLYETSKHFDDLRQMIKDISDAQSTSTSTGAFDSPNVDSLKVPVDTRDMRISPGQTI